MKPTRITEDAFDYTRPVDRLGKKDRVGQIFDAIETTVGILIIIGFITLVIEHGKDLI